MILSIITPTYNRANYLGFIYNSLLTNNKDDFEWIIVDDGSDDDTELIVREWLKEEKINLRYFKKENGGKTRAVKKGFDSGVKGKYTLVLDSDDYLVNGIISELKESLINSKPECIGLVGLKGNKQHRLIGMEFQSEYSTYTNLYFGKNNIHGDKLFIIKTAIYSSSIVLPYKDESFMPDNLPYINADRFGYLKCLNKIIYVGDYLEDGMTSNILNLAAKNIKGFIYEKKALQKEKLTFKHSIFNNIKYISYSLAANFSFRKIYNDSNNKFSTLILFLPTIILTRKRVKKIRKTRRSLKYSD